MIFDLETAATRGAHETGTVADNPVFSYLDAFDPHTAEVMDLKERYERRGVGNREFKDQLTTVLTRLLEPMRVRRAGFERNMPWVRDAVVAGSKCRRILAAEIMERVRDALGSN